MSWTAVRIHRLQRVVLACWLLLPWVAWADTSFTGRVVSIHDGDTLSVLREGKAVKVRLYGIDAPEKGQPFGTQAKAALATLAFQREVTVVLPILDRYKRLVADVLLPEGQSLSQAMVEAGYAWWYRQYSPHDTVLRRLELDAQTTKQGLWADAKPVAPWAWRTRQRQLATCKRLMRMP